MEKLEDVAGDVVAFLPSAARGIPGLVALARALVGNPIQRIENELWKLYTERGLDAAVGVQLENLGRLLDMPANDFSDSEYRALLRAKVLSNRSNGTIPEILAVFDTGAPEGSVATLVEYPPASFVLHVDGAHLSLSYVDALSKLLRESRGAAIRGVMHYQTVDDSAAFSTFGGPGPGFGDATDPSIGGALTGAID